MIFGRKSHPLPTFPENADRIFTALCEPLEPAAAEELRQYVQKFAKETLKEATTNLYIEPYLVQELVKRSELLFERYESLDATQRAMAIGAIRYFVSPDDPLPDKQFGTGFHDDAEVMNHVLEELGIEDYIVFKEV